MHLRREGDVVEKGDEHSHFAFGGSTVILVFGRDAIRHYGTFHTM